MIATSPRDRLSAHLIRQSTSNYFPGSLHGRSRRATKQKDPGAFAWTVRHLSDRKITSKSNQSRGPLFRHPSPSNRTALPNFLFGRSRPATQWKADAFPSQKKKSQTFVLRCHTHNCLFTHNKMAFHKDSGGEKGGKHTQSSHMRLGVALLSLLTQ